MQETGRPIRYIAGFTMKIRKTNSQLQFDNVYNAARNALCESHAKNKALSTKGLGLLSALLNFYERRCSELVEVIELGDNADLKRRSQPFLAEKERTGVIYQLDK